jgi:SprT protein
MTNNEVHEWIKYACECNGNDDIADKIRLKWSNRMTSAMGIASFDPKTQVYTIKLSVPLFKRATEEQKRQTVIHEACHIVEVVNRGYVDWNGRVVYPRMSHGPYWAKAMRNADCKPDVYHKVSNDGLRKKYIYECPNCCAEFKLSAILHNRCERGRHRICGKCKSRIVWRGYYV